VPAILSDGARASGFVFVCRCRKEERTTGATRVRFEPRQCNFLSIEGRVKVRLELSRSVHQLRHRSSLCASIAATLIGDRGLFRDPVPINGQRGSESKETVGFCAPHSRALVISSQFSPMISPMMEKRIMETTPIPFAPVRF
jgi:hypothetical protein